MSAVPIYSLCKKMFVSEKSIVDVKYNFDNINYKSHKIMKYLILTGTTSIKCNLEICGVGLILLTVSFLSPSLIINTI